MRELAPQVLGSLVRREGDFDACEDAVQEALLAAAAQWPREGVPANPRGWLATVASRRLIEQRRSEAARRRREETAARLDRGQGDAAVAVGAGAGAYGGAAAGIGGAAGSETDDTLTLLLLCCHPSLTQASQVALTLRAVGGLTTAEIARAFLVPESTIGQRISRAKAQIKASGARFEMPAATEREARLAALLHVLYLIFNEGYAASSGESLVRVDLTAEAIRLTRQLHAELPGDGEVQGLLALMLLTDARRAARTAPDGALVPLDEQDRSRWNGGAIGEGVALVTEALATKPVGPYQLQAAIAAVHDEAPTAAETDWRQILVLYDLLREIAPGPMVELSRIVALAMVEGPAPALAALETARQDPALAAHHRTAAVGAHLLEMAGGARAAAAEYEAAARRTLSVPEQRYLMGRARWLSSEADVGPARGRTSDL